jgi:hypothetical protein
MDLRRNRGLAGGKRAGGGREAAVLNHSDECANLSQGDDGLSIETFVRAIEFKRVFRS